MDGLNELKTWLGEHKRLREEKALGILKTDQTKYELSVLGGELKALDDVMDQVVKIFKERAAS